MSHRIPGAVPAVLALGLLLALSAAAAPAGAQDPAAPVRTAGLSSTGTLEDDLAAVRAATEKYRDVNVALADGYVQHPMCIVATTEGQPKQLGAMGYHYFRPDLLAITAEQPRVDGTGTHEDWLQPAILLYEPQADGSLALTAVENLIWAKAWHEAGHDGPPEFHGNDYYFMIDNPETEVDEAHGFQPHYELHWWVHRDNPAGAFAPFNPAVSCEHDRPEHHAAH